MKPVYVIGENIVSPIAPTAEENFTSLKKGITGIRLHDNRQISPEPFYAALFDAGGIPENAENSYTKFERLLIMSIGDALRKTGVPVASRRTALIISSTKGNISLIESAELTEALRNRIALSTSARLIADHFGFTSQPVVISHACISGVVGLITALRMLQSGGYDHVV
ncbi:MAG: beta-ketoacyl synthase, partial [Sphingobacteriales bacterium]|nr:beta-ketoacyl synthase [Sphingobacteriales bacterium]